MTAAASIESLIRLARAGDSDALGTLLNRLRNYIRLLARLQIDRHLRSKIDPSDVAQETLLLAYQGFREFRGHTEQEFVAWQRRILAHNLVDRFRHYYQSQKRDVRLERSMQDSLEHSSLQLGHALVATGSSPSQSAQRREESVRLADALETLPEPYRDVLIYRHLEELPFKEVAQRMDRSVDSVEKLWVRGLAALRSVLEDDG